ALLALVGPDMPGHPCDVGASARAYVVEHRFGDRVRFEGPTTDTAPFYRAADLFVQPSHFEAFGSSAIEAMASGLPIVSSGVGGLGDFLVAGENALLHDARSADSIARARDRTQATELLHHTLGIKLIWGGVALVALMAAATILRSEWDVRIACYLLGGSLVLRSYMLTIRGVLQGLERFGWDSVVVAADRAILLTFGTIALAAGTGLRGLAIAFVAARAASLALAASLTQAQLGGVGLRFDRAVWRQLQTTALPL